MSESLQPSSDLHASRILPKLSATAGPKLRHYCQNCRQVFQASDLIQNKYFAPDHGVETLQQTFQHHDNLDGTVRSAAGGCNFCTFLHRCCTLHDLLDWGKEASSYDLNITCPDNFPHQGIVYIIPRARQDDKFPAALLFDSELDDFDIPQREKPYSTLKFSSTNSLETFSCARTWLQTCVEQHGMCSVSITGSPSLRLLSVNFDDVQVSVRLCEGPFENEKVPYLALSHCWGGMVPLQLTTKTRTKFLDSIPVEELPQTFWDAIVIVARLGYRFIWIDSLCIIQDSRVDWDEQVVFMGDIYRNSVCTITALSAENGHQGCFNTRNPLVFDKCWIGDSRWYFKKFKFDDDLSTVVGPSTIGRLCPPLHTRAWDVQERALSPRTLYYSAEMIYWECIESKASEYKPRLKTLWSGGEETGGKWIAHNAAAKSIFQCLLVHCRNTDYHRWKIYWRKLVEQYTACEITYFKDKWPAIAGLATNVEQLSGMVLLGGLWKDHLPEELLWSVIRAGTRPAKRPGETEGQSVETGTEEYAPSWGVDFDECQDSVDR